MKIQSYFLVQSMSLFWILNLLMTIPVFSQEKIDGWLVYNTTNSGLPDNHVRDIKVGKDQSLWVATWRGGVAHYKDNIWSIFNPSTSDMTSYSVNQLAIEKQTGHIWAATNRGGIAHYNGAMWASVELPGENTAECIAITKKGDKLVGTPRHGLYVYTKDGNLFKIWGQGEHKKNCVHHIAFDTKGNALVSTRQGLLQFRKTVMNGYTTSFKTLRRQHTLKSLVDRTGQIWANDFRTGQLLVFKKNKWQREKSLATNINISLNNEGHNYTLNDFTIFKSNRVVVGTKYFGGVAHYSKQHGYWAPIFTPYSGYELRGGITAVAEGKRESIWVGTYHRGLMVPVKHQKDFDSDSTETTASRFKRKRIKKARNYLKTRRVKIKDTVRMEAKAVDLLIWDAQQPDGDVISLIFNDEFLLEEFEVTKSIRRIRLYLKPGQANKLVMYAHNVGKIPPNTANLSVVYAGKHEEVQLKSDLVNAEGLIIINDMLETLDRKEKQKAKKQANEQTKSK